MKKKIRTSARQNPKDPWAIQYWKWTEYYNNREQLVRKTKPKMYSRILMI